MTAIIVALVELVATVRTVELFYRERWSLGFSASSMLYLGHFQTTRVQLSTSERMTKAAPARLFTLQLPWLAPLQSPVRAVGAARRCLCLKAS